MGKVIVIVLIVLIGLGGYWFYWEGGGSNAPIVVEYDLKTTGKIMFGPVPLNINANGTLGFLAKPNAFRVNADIDAGIMGKMKISAIYRLDKKKAYLILHDEKVYATDTFSYVPMSDTKKPEDIDFDWYDKFDVKVDGQWFGEKKERYFARKHSPKMEMQPGGPQYKVELWFTDNTELGSRYVKSINKLFRIEFKSDSKTASSIPGITDKGKEKREQFTGIDFPYFPVPLKVVLVYSDQQVGRSSMSLEAKKFSRKRVSSSEFKVPSDYKEISSEDLMKKINDKFPGQGR